MLQNTYRPGAVRPQEARLIHRLLFAVVALLAGEATMAILVRGQPLLPYFLASVAIGWAFFGLPLVIPLRSSLVSEISWPATVLAGCCLGSLALAGIFVGTSAIQALSGAGLARVSFKGLFVGTEPLWPVASLVSAVSVTTYWALVRRTWNQRYTSKLRLKPRQNS